MLFRSENVAAGSAIYTAVTTDGDGTVANRGVVYSLKAATGDVASLVIDSATGAVRLATGSPNFESKGSYAFTVVATDGSSWWDADVSEETYLRTNLGALHAGDVVNLERPMALERMTQPALWPGRSALPSEGRPGLP